MPAEDRNEDDGDGDGDGDGGSDRGARSSTASNARASVDGAFRAKVAGALRAKVAGALRALWTAIRPPLSIALQVLAALILLFEEWGWRPLAEALAYLSRFKLFARMELAIAGLPPYAALATLALPTSLLFPLKLLAVYLVAQGQFVAASMLFVGAKIASTALIARLFLLTKPALMQIGWFAAIYGVIVPWKDALFARIRASWAWRYGRMVKTRVRLEAKKAWLRIVPFLDRSWSSLKTRAQAWWKRIGFRPG
jgi:hypothetical protein